MTDTLLSVSNLTTHLGSPDRPVRVVEGVDLEIRRGETFALLGESGCGKSMLALSLMRLLPPAGRVVSGTVLMSPHAGGGRWGRGQGAPEPAEGPSRPGGRSHGDLDLSGIDLLQLPEHTMRQVRGGRMAMIFQEPQTSLNPVLTIGAQIAEAVRVHQGRAGRLRSGDGSGTAPRGRHPRPGAPGDRVPPPTLRGHEAAGHDRHGPGRGPRDPHRRRAHHGP